MIDIWTFTIPMAPFSPRQCGNILGKDQWCDAFFFGLIISGLIKGSLEVKLPTIWRVFGCDVFFFLGGGLMIFWVDRVILVILISEF